jgi:adenosylhomocysteine nucleosidase
MGRVIAGVIGSAHQVNLELDRVAWTHKIFGMDVEEMESGPAAAIARAFGVRYIAFRVVSDAPYAGIRFQESAAKATGLASKKRTLIQAALMLFSCLFSKATGEI